MKNDSSNTQSPKTAVSWHSEVAEDFDASYRKDMRFQERHSVWRSLIDKYCTGESRTLDLGCGSGQLLDQISAITKDATGLDGSKEMLEISRRRLADGGKDHIPLVCSPIEELEALRLGNFDLVVASSVFEYLKDLNVIFEQVVRTVNPNGLLAFSIPNKSSIYRRLEPVLYRLFGKPAYYPFVENVMTIKEVRQLATAYGLELIHVQLTSPTPYASRLLRPLGLGRFSDNLAVYVCRKSTGR